MWVEKLKSGKFRCAERYVDPFTGKTKKISVVVEKDTRSTRKEAVKILEEKIRKICEYSPDQEITFSDLVERYRKYQSETVKASTFKRNYWQAETLKKIIGDDTLVNKINAGFITDRMMETGKEGGTLNEHMTRLKAILRWGYRQDYIKDISYLDKIERFKEPSKRQKVEDKYLEASEAEQLINGIKINKWKDLTRFLILSGLRFGEAAALCVSDIDFKAREIHVRKTYDYRNDVVTSPKTQTSIRDVYMQDDLYKMCVELRSKALSRNINVIDPLLFCDDQGNHITFFAYDKYLRENSAKIIGRKITPHTLRHTHASLMFEQGVDIESISRRLGHADSRVTKEIYLHVTNARKEKENERIKNVKLI